MKISEIISYVGAAQARHCRVVILSDSPLQSLKRGPIGRGGGQAATWLSQIAAQFEHASGLEFVWVQLKPGSKETKLERWGKQFFLELAHPKMSIDLALNYYFAKRQLSMLLRGLGANIVHCWGTENLHAVATVVSPCPVVLSMQGILTQYQKIGALNKMWQWRVLAKNEVRWVKAATFVTSESQWGLDQLITMGRTTQVRKIEYGVHPSFYDLVWEPDPNDPFLLYSGTIDWRKGLDVLVEAAKILSAKRWRLEIAGDGVLRDKLERMDVPGVTWLGSLTWTELQQRMRKAWGFVLPTRADTSPNSVKEARVVGLPIITTSAGGQAGYVFDGLNGYLVEPLDAAALSVACDKLMSSYAQAKSMGSARHEEDRDYFLPTHTARSFIELYQELSW